MGAISLSLVLPCNAAIAVVLVDSWLLILPLLHSGAVSLVVSEAICWCGDEWGCCGSSGKGGDDDENNKHDDCDSAARCGLLVVVVESKSVESHNI